MIKFNRAQLDTIIALMNQGIPVRIAAGFKEPTLLIPECDCRGRYDMTSKECDCTQFCSCHKLYLSSQQEGGKDE